MNNKINNMLTSFMLNPLAKENNSLASKQASKQALYNIIRYNEKPGRGVENRHYARAFFTLLLFLLCLPLAAQGQELLWRFNGNNHLNINQENTNYIVTGSFNDEQQGGPEGSSAINIRGGEHHNMTFSDVTITMSKPKSKAMNLENNTTLNLELEGQNTITYGGIWRVSSLITLPFLFPEMMACWK